MSDIKKVVISIRGGLGNQLFQFAFAHIVSRQLGEVTTVLDTRSYRNYYWPFFLDKYELKPRVTFFSNTPQKYDRAIRWFRIRRGILKRITKNQTTRYNEKAWEGGVLLSERFCPLPTFPVKKDVETIYLYGYFQDATLLIPYRSELKAMFVPKSLGKTALNIEDRTLNKSIAISIRLRDAKEGHSNSFLYDGKDYYITSVQKILKRDPSIQQIVVACNDLKRIQNEHWFDAIPLKQVFLNEMDAVEQLYLLSKCHHFVCANSTFSWWAAFLGSDETSIVYLPRYFYNGVETKQTKLLFPGVEIG